MRFQATCTLESNTQPPRTHRATFDGVSPLKAVSRVLRAAKTAYPGVRWSSLVVVLEKQDDPRAVG